MSCETQRSKLPTIYLRFGGYWLEVKNTDYATPNPASSDNCQLLLGVNEDFWALGMAVIRGYYVSHDLTNDRLGFVPQSDSLKSVPVYDPAKSTDTTTPLTDTTYELPSWALDLIIGVAVAIAVVIIFVLVFVPPDEEYIGDDTDTYYEVYLALLAKVDKESLDTPNVSRMIQDIVTAVSGVFASNAELMLN